MKSLSELTQGDERQKYFGSLDALHDTLSEITVDENVPPKVKELFDTARNLSLCTWFVYDFHPIAELTGFLALEAALKERASRESPELAEEKSFSRLIKRAIADGWVAEDRISGRREIAHSRVQQRKAIETIQQADASGLDSMPIQEPTEAEIEQEAAEMQIIESICAAAIRLRNALAHGEPYLDPGSPRRLRITADLINQLFT